MSIEGRKLLVTGGTGALGRAVVLAATDPRRVPVDSAILSNHIA